MVQAIIVTVLPFLFLIVLFGGGARFQSQNINQDGAAPINGAVFYTSKYLIVVIWAAMVLHFWGIDLSLIQVPPPLRYISLGIWICGFLLLFAGRFTMGQSFRIGSPNEDTCLKVGGLFCISRNPMYLGVFSTLLAAALATLNPFILLVAVLIIAVHHGIVLAEENYLENAFGEEYRAYCRRVRRYI